MPYRAPVKDMLFAMKELANIDAVAQLPGYEEAGFDTAQAVLEECAKFNEGVVSPTNAEGDKNPSFWKNGTVTTTPGFKDAFRQFAEGGWQGLHHPTDFGGQGLPKLIHAACIEMVNSANLSFALCPLLTDGAIEALLTAGSDESCKTFGGFHDEPIGPHPVANAQVIFKPEQFQPVIEWLMLHRDGLDVLIHPLTDNSVDDHSIYAMWLGSPVPLKLDVLRRNYRAELLPSA